LGFRRPSPKSGFFRKAWTGAGKKVPTHDVDERPPLVTAIQWVAQITTISLEMALPAALGYWLDERCGTDPWLVIIGAVLGFATAMWHLLQLTSKRNFRARDKSSEP
jgi:hypothetical protein